MLLNLVCGAVGILLIFTTLRDIFLAVILPRAANLRWRIGVVAIRMFWRFWPRFALAIRDDDRREDFLGSFAPLMIVMMLALWIVMLTVGYGLVFYALRDELRPQPTGFVEALYYAGTSVLTIGYGDFVATHGLARLISLVAGASGLSILAVVTSFLFAIFGAFQRRETFVVTLGARSGSPPSGVGMLVIHGKTDLVADLDGVLKAGQEWTAGVMESHLAYPILIYFRSSHDFESWVATLGALLDASVLLITTVETRVAGQARIMFNVGRHATHDIAHYFRIRDGETVGIDRSEFEHACDRLAESGYTLRDRDEAWEKFSAMRSNYAAQLNALARFLEIPPVQWIGDRSLIVSHMAKVTSRQP